MVLKDITIGSFTSVADLIDFSDKTLYDLFAFRGQPGDYGTLVPSFQRQFTRQSFGTAEVIEKRLIQAFRAHYKTLPDRSPEMPLAIRIDEGFDLRCLSVMQHYEIPTRLLDWSTSFWTSVYFACASEPNSDAELWFYNRALFSPGAISYDPSMANLQDQSEFPQLEPKLLYLQQKNLVYELDPKITPRMKQQFAHHTVSTNVFADHAPLIHDLILNHVELPGQNQLEEGEPLPLFGRFIIDKSCKSKTLQFLADEKSITAGTIFPDVVGLSRFLKWQFESLKTMLL